jgi:hypothetical protein
MSFLLFRKPVFTPAQLERFANIFDNAGQVALGIMVLAHVVQGIDKTNLLVLILGAIDVTACWTGSIILSRAKEVKDK